MYCISDLEDERAVTNLLNLDIKVHSFSQATLDMSIADVVKVNVHAFELHPRHIRNVNFGKVHHLTRDVGRTAYPGCSCKEVSPFRRKPSECFFAEWRSNLPRSARSVIKVRFFHGVCPPTIHSKKGGSTPPQTGNLFFNLRELEA